MNTFKRYYYMKFWEIWFISNKKVPSTMLIFIAVITKLFRCIGSSESICEENVDIK